MKYKKIWLAIFAATVCLSLTSCDLLNALREVKQLHPTPEEMEEFVYGKWECVKAGPYLEEDNGGNDCVHDDNAAVSYLESVTFSAENVVFKFSEPVPVAGYWIGDGNGDDLWVDGSYVTELVCDMNDFNSTSFISHYMLVYDEGKGESIWRSITFVPKGESPLDYIANWGNTWLYGTENYDEEIKGVDYMILHNAHDSFFYELKKVE